VEQANLIHKTQEIKQHMNKSDEEYRRKILEMEKSKI
jgi:hypothetical protein